MAPVLIQYLEWHFFDVPRAILLGWRNFLSFNLRYFSITPLLRTFFSYWHRYRASYGRGFDFKVYFETWTFNLISRVIGAAMRSIIIVFGLLAQAVILVAGLIIFVGWLLLPLLLVLAVIWGFKLL